MESFFLQKFFLSFTGLPPTSLTADKNHIFWSNETLGKVYSVPKSGQRAKSRDSEDVCDSLEMSPVVEEEIRGIRSIRAIGNHLQPYPDPTCLVFESYRDRAKFQARSSSTLTLYLPPMQRPEHCSNMSSPSVQYTVFYALSDVSCFEDLNCQKVVRIVFPSCFFRMWISSK